MSKQSLYVTVYYFDEQYDVEVYNWIKGINEIGDKIERISVYALESKEEVEEHINWLKGKCDIVEVKYDCDTKEGSNEKMDLDMFWKLIDESLKREDLKQQREWIVDTLSKMSDRKIKSFGECLRKIQKEMRSHKHYRHAYRLSGVSGGDDSVDYFGGWLISRGKETFYDILNNPLDIDGYLTNKALGQYGKATNELFLYSEDYAIREKYKEKAKI